MPDWTFRAIPGTTPAMQCVSFTRAAISELQVRPVERHEEQRYQEQMALHHYLGRLSKIGETLWYRRTRSGYGEQYHAPKRVFVYPLCRNPQKLVSVRFSPASKRRFFPCAKAPFGLGARLSSRFPPRRQQFIDTAVGMRRQTRQHIGQIRQRLNAIHLGRLNQTHDVGGVRTRSQAATEEPILAIMRRFT